MITERGVAVDHSTIHRWVQHFAPAGQALSSEDRARARRRGPPRRLPWGDPRSLSSPLCSPRSSSRRWARSGARAGSATPRPRSPPSTTSSPRCRPRPWTTPSASGPASTAHAPVAMDGKALRGASAQTEDGRRMMVAAVEHGSGVVLGQVEVDSKSNEIPAVRELSSGLDLTGRTVTVDAMHAPHETARCLLGRRADYVLSAIKDNQKPSSKTSRQSTGATRPGTKPSTRPMAASSADAAPSSTSPAPSGTVTPISMVAARRCASNARSSKPASAASR